MDPYELENTNKKLVARKVFLLQ